MKTEAEKKAEVAARHAREAVAIKDLSLIDRPLTESEHDMLSSYLATTNLGFDDGIDIKPAEGMFYIQHAHGSARPYRLADRKGIGAAMRQHAYARLDGEHEDYYRRELKSWRLDKTLKSATLFYVAKTWSDLAEWMLWLARNPE